MVEHQQARHMIRVIAFTLLAYIFAGSIIRVVAADNRDSAKQWAAIATLCAVIAIMTTS